MLVQQILHAMDGETVAHSTGEQHIPITALRLTQPSFHYSACGSGKRRAAFLAPLAHDAHVSTGAEYDVVAGEPGHLGYAQAGLYGQEKKRVIAPAEPAALVRSSEQGVDFRTREKLDQGPRETLAGNGKHALNLSGVVGGFERCVPKEGVKRCEAQIPAANTQAVLLQPVPKRHDQGRVNRLEVQTRWRFMQ